MKLNKGPLVHLREADHQGSRPGRRIADRKAVGRQAGKPYNAEYPEFFLARIKDQGLFDGLGETKA